MRHTTLEFINDPNFIVEGDVEDEDADRWALRLAPGARCNLFSKSEWRDANAKRNLKVTFEVEVEPGTAWSSVVDTITTSLTPGNRGLNVHPAQHFETPIKLRPGVVKASSRVEEVDE